MMQEAPPFFFVCFVIFEPGILKLAASNVWKIISELQELIWPNDNIELS